MDGHASVPLPAAPQARLGRVTEWSVQRVYEDGACTRA